MEIINEIKAIFDLKKLPTKFFIVFAIVSGFILFANKELLTKLNLAKLDENYGTVIGLTFLFSTGLVIINLLIWGFNKIYFQYRFGKAKKELEDQLRNLDPFEKSVIREFAITQQNSISMPYDDSTVSGLIDKNILKFNKQFGNSMITNMGRAPISLTKYAEKLLKAEDLDLGLDMTENEIEKCFSTRPHWANR